MDGVFYYVVLVTLTIKIFSSIQIVNISAECNPPPKTITQISYPNGFSCHLQLPYKEYTVFYLWQNINNTQNMINQTYVWVCSEQFLLNVIFIYGVVSFQ